MSISPASLANLRHDGRPPAFTESEALALLKSRVLAGSGTNMTQFIEGELQEGGTLPRRVSVPTMARLMSGKMHPELIDPETGKRFDYSRVPSASSGRPSRFVDGVDPVTNEKKGGMPKLRKQLIEITLEECRRVTDARCIYNFTVLRRELEEKIARQHERILELERISPGRRAGP